MKIRHCDLPSVAPVHSNLPIVNNLNMEVEEEDEEDEDVDFNPFLREDTPSEASSSLSTENKGPSENVEIFFRGSSDGIDASVSSKLPEEMQCCEDEETVMQTTVQERNDFSGNPLDEEPTSSIQQGEGEGCAERSYKDLSSRIGRQGEGEGCAERSNKDLSSRIGSDGDDEDAICKRTRARHSLANYTLEELETFLQESDDDGDLPNVDDEEEYRKFLTAVLVGGAEDGKDGQDDNVEEDEENDADFELEIEEALESDADENLDYKRMQEVKQQEDAHMPVTRQKKRMKESTKNKKTHLGKAKVLPLCPLLPYESSAHQWKFSPPKFHCSDIGFTAQQIGQLYCLIHEHVQLLVQVFSVSILDPSSQQVATEVQKMLVEMNFKREEALGLRNIPYPGFCFHPPNLYPSRQFELEQADNYSYWSPLINIPVLSILDVAPLRLVKSFMTNVSDTVVKYRRCQVEDVSNRDYLIKEPLFPLPILESSSETNKETSVDSTKKQQVVLVPKDIARSAQRFYPLFNAALFPHKPPTTSFVNRVLFTNAEDGLLAMGLMEYNNDWEAIQQRFLPCKSKHQIFVRQKNRSSSRAPENPIKAVRRMKTSPLTSYEIARICEGLKLFKNDWGSVWRFFIPHRDPSLLPRQWRIANGIQKSYKQSEDKKEKRRLYEAKRRESKASLDDCPTSSELEVDNKGYSSAGDMDGEDEAYVHEAFVAEPEPRSSKCLSYMNKSNLQTTNMMPCKGNHISEACVYLPNGSGDEPGTSSFRDVCSPCPLPKQPSSNLVARVSKLCQTRKTKSARIVKLAPDLPPVNLPPSVRVISQSNFKSFNNKPSSSKTVDNAKVGGSLLNPQEHLVDNGQEAGNTPISQFGADENTSDTVLQMHPLLFQTHEGQLSSYFSSNCHGAGAGSGIYNFFPGKPVQSGLNLFRPRFPVRSDACRNVAQQSEKADSTTIDFHPLLQRIDNENESNLDLDIRLCSTADKGETLGSDITDHNVEKTVPQMKHRKYSDVSDTGNLSVEAFSCSQREVYYLERPASNEDVRPCMGNLNDDSMAGIVMEHEELSDSEEDIEDVEFECEEIDDSEGDEMEGELPTEVQNKELPFFISKEKGNRASKLHQATNLKKQSVSEDENCTNPMQASQNVCTSEPLLVKHKCDEKRKKKRSSDSSDVHSSQTTAAASRKPIKRSL